MTTPRAKPQNTKNLILKLSAHPLYDGAGVHCHQQENGTYVCQLVPVQIHCDGEITLMDTDARPIHDSRGRRRIFKDAESVFLFARRYAIQDEHVQLMKRSLV